MGIDFFEEKRAKMSDPILKRVAVRKYTSERVSSVDVAKLITAFQAAPCGMHQTEDMEMTVVEDKKLLERIEKTTKNACYKAPLLFVINVKKSSEFKERDASAAAENIMVEAASLGLGSVYLMNAALVLNSDTSLEKDLGLSSGFETCVIVACGHAAEHPNDDRSNRYKVIRR